MSVTKRRGVRRAHPSLSALDIRQLRAFVAMVDHGTMTAAAQALGLAQSTVSESLAALERGFGTRMIARRRGSHDVTLTAAGDALLPHARAVLAALDAAHAAVVGVASDVRATVEIVANESVSTYMLPRALAPLRVRWPRTRFAVSVATCPGVRAGVSDGAYDVGLWLEPAGAPGPACTDRARDMYGERMERTVIAADVPLVVFASPSHSLVSTGARTAVRRDELAACPFFISDSAGDFYTLLRDFFEAGGLPGPALEPAGSVEGVKRGVATNPHALGILPAYAVGAELRARQFASVTLQPAPPRMMLEALLSAARPRHPSVGAMLDAIRHEAAALGRARA